MKTAWGLLLAVMIATPIYSELSVVREIRQAGSAPMKKFYASSNGNLSIIDFGIKSISTVQATGNANLQVNTVVIPNIVDSDIIAQVTRKPLNYPNPFRKENGTTFYYSLSKSMDIEIRIYDLLANEIIKVIRNAGLSGASVGPNKIGLGDLGVDPHSMAAGAYFYVIMNNGKVLAKGKMAVLP
jgi:hypothetical protein